MKKIILYSSFIAIFSMLSCQKDASNATFGISDEGSNSSFSESSANVGSVLFTGSIVARRTDADMLPAYKELFTKYSDLQAIVYSSRNVYYGLMSMPPAHATTTTGYSCDQISQNCNLENIGIIDMEDRSISDTGGRGIMSWIAGVLGFN